MATCRGLVSSVQSTCEMTCSLRISQMFFSFPPKRNTVFCGGGISVTLADLQRVQQSVSLSRRLGDPESRLQNTVTRKLAVQYETCKEFFLFNRKTVVEKTGCTSKRNKNLSLPHPKYSPVDKCTITWKNNKYWLNVAVARYFMN